MEAFDSSSIPSTPPTRFRLLGPENKFPNRFPEREQARAEAYAETKKQTEQGCIPGDPEDKRVVLEAVRLNGLCLRSAADGLRGDREVVLEAVRENGESFAFAAKSLREDREILIEACRSNAQAVKHVPEKLHRDIDVMSALVAVDPVVLQFAKAPLKPNDERLLRAAGLHQESPLGMTRSFVLSVRFSLKEGASPIASLVHKRLDTHASFRNLVYDPNLVSKGFCGWPANRMTDKSWPCRGDCAKELHACKNILACSCIDAIRLLLTAHPNRHTCWRKSFRWHLEQAKRSNGAMIQIVEYDKAARKYTLGKGQQIEEEIARSVEIKVFSIKICEDHPTIIDAATSALDFAIQRWITSAIDDLSEESVVPKMLWLK